MERVVQIRQMEQGDAEKLAVTFAEWGKTGEKFQTYHEQRQQDSRAVLVADSESRIVAYTTLVWQSAYDWFETQGIPEIVDLNVIGEYQRRGIGASLIHAAEELARSRSKTRVGISVQQSPEYVAAHRMYLMLGYIPDGHGVTPHDNELHLIKTLAAEPDMPK